MANPVAAESIVASRVDSADITRFQGYVVDFVELNRVIVAAE